MKHCPICAVDVWISRQRSKWAGRKDPVCRLCHLTWGMDAKQIRDSSDYLKALVELEEQRTLSWKHGQRLSTPSTH